MSFEIPHERRVLGRLITDSARQFGDLPFLTVGGQTYTYTEAFAESQAVARGLSKLGVKPQEPVLVMLDNSAEFIFAWFGLALLNAVCVPVNTAYAGTMLGYVTQDAGARVAITDTALAPRFADLPDNVRGGLQHVVVAGDSNLPHGDVFSRWDDMREPAGADILEPAKPLDTAFICYTSGTTGPSKGVVLPHALAAQTIQTIISVLGIRPDDVIFSPLPLFHGMSRTMATLPAMVLGAHVHLGRRFSATNFWQEAAACKATVGLTIFTIPPILKARPPSPHDRAHRLRVMYNAHHDPEFEARFGVRLVEAHAMTETGMTIFTPFPERKLGASGKPGKDWEVALVDDNDAAVPVGEIGELVLRPRRPGILMKGYLNKPDTTWDACRNLWFHTGDLMRCDEDGYYFFAGRKKERIRRRGENISAYEVECVAAQHPDISTCAVVGVPAGDGEDEVYLVAVLRDGAQAVHAPLHGWLRERLPKFMVPRYIEFRASLPMTGSEKVEKHTLIKTVPATGAWDSLKA